MTEQTTEQVFNSEHLEDEQAGVKNLTPEPETPEPDDREGQMSPSDDGVGPVGPKPSPHDEPDTFPRAYVEKLRDENAKHRQRAADRDDLAQRLHTALVAATGRLHDPDDLPFSEDHLTDPEALSTAVEDLLARRPHLASRKPSGDVGQGATSAGESVDLLGMLRSRA